MRKIIYAMIFMLFFSTTSIFAQNSDLKHYSDYSLGFEGYAGSFFIGDFSDIEKDITPEETIALLNEKLGDSLESVAKLTKNNSWLLKKALNEWEYKKGELYAIICADSYYAQNGILIFAIIDGRESYKWCAFFINVDDIDVFSHIFDEDE